MVLGYNVGIIQLIQLGFDKLWRLCINIKQKLHNKVHLKNSFFFFFFKNEKKKKKIKKNGIYIYIYKQF